MDPTTQRLMMGSRQLKTVSFNTAGSYTWFAPNNVFVVSRLTGRGGSGVLGEWNALNDTFRYVIGEFFINNPNPDNFPTLMGSSITYENTRDRIANESMLSQWQAITTSSNGAIYTPTFEHYNFRDGNWYRGVFTYSQYLYRRIGTVSAVGRGEYFGNPDLMTGSGNIPTTVPSGGTGKSINGAAASNVEVNFGSIGGNSSALGYTFEGSTDGVASETIYLNIPVTPNAGYTIVVGNNAGTTSSFIKLEYY